MKKNEKETEKQLNNSVDETSRETQVQAIKTSEFMKETIKKRPINKRKLFRKLITTILAAVIFGLVACLTFLLLEPMISEKLNPQKEEEVEKITFESETEEEETKPEDLIFDESELQQTTLPETQTTVDEQQIEKIIRKIERGSDYYLQMSSVVTDMIRQVSSSLVSVVGISQETDMFHNEVSNESVVTGVIVADNGRDILILANLAKLKSSESLEVVFSDETSYIGEILASDSVSGYGIVSINKSMMRLATLDSISVIEMGSSAGKYLNGIPIVALGRPMGVADSVGIGTITSCSVGINLPDSSYHLITTDIYGSPQGSGILVNIKGQLMGMLDMNYTLADMPNNICGIGISEMKRMIEKLSNGNPIPYLGIYASNVTEEISEELDIPKGVYVTELCMDSPLLDAGLQSGDIITDFAGKYVETFQDLNNLRLSMNPLDSVKITVRRQGADGFTTLQFMINLAFQGE